MARVTIDESVWKYGPEYVFDVEMNVTSTPMNHDGVQTSNYTVMNLFCRPTGSDRLYCHLGNVRRQSIDITNDNKIDIPEEQSRHLMSEEPFEIKFSESGIDHLTVNDQVEVEHLNNFKLIAERLNIGVDLNGVPDGTFHVTENTTIGECDVTVTINHYPSKRMMNKIKNNRYELESLARLNKVPSETILIQKTTNLNNCSYYASFYFGSYGANIVVEADLDSHLVSDFIHDIRRFRRSFFSFSFRQICANYSRIILILFFVICDCVIPCKSHFGNFMTLCKFATSHPFVGLILLVIS